MIIKQLINEEDIWEDFLNFCLRSKPYLDFCCGSRIMRINAARRIFNGFCESSDVYACDDTSYIFNIELADYNCIQFAFTNHSKSNSQKVKAFHGIMDHIRNINGKYFVSENRRTFKVDFYKKWLDRYDKRVIIVNNKDESILWYNKEKMEKTLKVVGTNRSARHLQDKIVKYDIINVESGINACVTQISIDDEKYLFDCKRISLREGKVLIQGMISDDKTFVANIALEFNP